MLLFFIKHLQCSKLGIGEKTGTSLKNHSKTRIKRVLGIPHQVLGRVPCTRRVLKMDCRSNLDIKPFPKPKPLSLKREKGLGIGLFSLVLIPDLPKPPIIPPISAIKIPPIDELFSRQ